jgi:hypothetical protein
LNEVRRLFSGKEFSEIHFTFGKMAGAAGLEPVTSAVTGQRSNQLSYAPAQVGEIRRCRFPSQRTFQKIRAADAKEVGVENPAEETYYCPNQIEPMLGFRFYPVNLIGAF